MGFPQRDVDDLLAKCHRRCCICHRFCGVKMETDHIIPRGNRGPDTIDNAIPLCFECHAEVHMYNDRHPRGRKYHPDELRKHKEQWITICTNSPNILVESPRISDPGPISSLLTELEFNKIANSNNKISCLYETKQFDRAVAEGILSLANDELKNNVMETYAKIKDANLRIDLYKGQRPDLHTTRSAESRAEDSIVKANSHISPTIEKIRAFLSAE